MKEYQEVPVTVARDIAHVHEKDIVCIVCWSHEHALLHTTTYGKMPDDKVAAAKLGEICAKAAGSDLTRLTEYEDFRKDFDAGLLKASLELLKACSHALRSYQCGNKATGLAKELAENIDKLLKGKSV